MSTISGVSPAELASALRQMPSYRSLVWAMRVTMAAIVVWMVAMFSGAGLLAVVGLACPAVSLLLLLAMLLAVVFSHTTAGTRDDSLPEPVTLLVGICSSAIKDTFLWNGKSS